MLQLPIVPVARCNIRIGAQVADVIISAIGAPMVPSLPADTARAQSSFSEIAIEDFSQVAEARSMRAIGTTTLLTECVITP